MLRKDFKPNRLAIALQTAKNFFQTKLSIDPKDRVCVISFGKITKKLTSFEFDEEKLSKSLKNINISGKGEIHDAIAFSMQLLVAEMRKIGGKIQRILIISDDKLKSNQDKLQKMIKIAKGLGIFVDACQLGKTQDYRESTLKKIAQMTGGEYGFFNNSKAIINAGRAFASKKNVKTTSDYLGPSQEKDIPPLVSEIALPLRRPTVMDIRLMMRRGDRGQDKCQICHSIKAPITSADFYSEGRYCPSCDRAMHMSCAAMWARGSEYKDNIFRCPFCYFLLELPKSATKLIPPEDEDKDKAPVQKIRIITEEVSDKTVMIAIADEMVNQIDASCSYCHSIFLGDYKVFKCQKCGAFYHEPCLKKIYHDVKACRFCGAQISFDS
jgi:hypothetical protein